MGGGETEHRIVAVCVVERLSVAASKSGGRPRDLMRRCGREVRHMRRPLGCFTPTRCWGRRRGMAPVHRPPRCRLRPAPHCSAGPVIRDRDPPFEPMNQGTHPEELPAEVLDDVASVVGAEVTLLGRLPGGVRQAPPHRDPVGCGRWKSPHCRDGIPVEHQASVGGSRYRSILPGATQELDQKTTKVDSRQPGPDQNHTPCDISENGQLVDIDGHQ